MNVKNLLRARDIIADSIVALGPDAILPYSAYSDEQALNLLAGDDPALVPDAIRSAEIVAWRSDIYHDVVKNANNFEGYPFAPPVSFLKPQLWLWYDKATGEPFSLGATATQDYQHIGWLISESSRHMILGIQIWTEVGEAFSPKLLIGILGRRDVKLEAQQLHSPDRGPLSDVHEDPRRIAADTLILCLSSFMDSKIAQVDEGRLPRSERRREAKAAKKKYRSYRERTIKVVNYRRPDRPKGNPSGSGSVDWQHRWMVEPHVRNQWYPSEQVHRPIWIDTYVKGPSDKPMLVHAETMKKVCR